MRLFALHLHRSVDPWAEAPPWALELRALLGFIINEQEAIDMATKENLDTLKATVRANTSAVQSAKLALEGFAKAHAEDMKKLADAVANSDASDDPDVKAAIDEINANNAALISAIPEVASNVAANTTPAPT